MPSKARIVAQCPDCQSNVNLPSNPELWMRLTCPECGTQLEIVDDDPWDLDYAEDFEDDELEDELELEEEEEDDDFEDFEELDEDQEDEGSYLY
jgi:lysine biosynthesis protein LysW